MDVGQESLSPRLDGWTFVDDESSEESSTPSPMTTDSAGGQTLDVPEGHLRIRLRIGEQIRPAYFKATQVVEDFTSMFFAEALADGKRVRLIYMGMLLIHDRTMGEYGIEEDGVIHAVVTDSAPTPHQAASDDVELKGFTNPANTLLVSTGFILYGLWTLLYHFPHLFSWKAIVLLAILSIGHISATVSRLAA
ncbi:hypothetical protein PINS_up003786 [Pythium insidiosum]|nr:hypothetical protein PINS_up003786 [Pythium insidiosum]